MMFCCSRFDLDSMQQWPHPLNLVVLSPKFCVAAVFTIISGMVLFTAMLDTIPRGPHNPLTIWGGTEYIFLLQVWLQA